MSAQVSFSLAENLLDPQKNYKEGALIGAVNRGVTEW
jgi:hypothetical protein